jgi:hypothetical protein
MIAISRAIGVYVSKTVRRVCCVAYAVLIGSGCFLLYLGGGILLAIGSTP